MEVQKSKVLFDDVIPLLKTESQKFKTKDHPSIVRDTV